jgi:hypothetical protein
LPASLWADTTLVQLWQQLRHNSPGQVLQQTCHCSAVVAVLQYSLATMTKLPAGWPHLGCCAAALLCTRREYNRRVREVVEQSWIEQDA